MINTATKRGRIGRARRQAKNAVNTYVTRSVEKDAVAAAREKRVDDQEERQDLAVQHWDAEKIKLAREKEARLRAVKAKGRRPR